MQNNTVNVNAQCRLSPDELETLLRAEIEITSRGMQEHLQQFADLRDRNTQAQFKLIALRAVQAV